jgi:hypothetical protein
LVLQIEYGLRPIASARSAGGFSTRPAHLFVYEGVNCQQASGMAGAFELIHQSVECHVRRMIDAFRARL